MSLETPKIGFGINTYDYEGDLIDKCITLHVGENFILQIPDVKGLRSMIENLEQIEKEIKENYPDELKWPPLNTKH
jgi:hypothetical protein